MIKRILEQYNHKFGTPKIYIKSPGRANIIGEHTDYNKGLVLPFAIEQCIHFYMGTNQSRTLRLFAYDLKEYKEYKIDQLQFKNDGWERYFINALVVLNLDINEGVDVVFGGNLPHGGGISSSSALACGFLSGLNSLFDLSYTVDELVGFASETENGIGLNGGIMDQTAILKGKKDKALKIDFLDLTLEEVDMPSKAYTFYLFHSGQTHNLVETGYNDRRSSCEKALSIIQKVNPKINSLRDLSSKDLTAYALDDVLYRRCKHVIEESNRVLDAVQVLRSGQYRALGNLLLKSHESLSNYYEVSTPEIDSLVAISQTIPGILGSRIMGGGFGGCTINFVEGKLEAKDIDTITTDYFSKTGLNMTVLEVEASSGVEVNVLDEKQSENSRT